MELMSELYLVSSVFISWIFGKILSFLNSARLRSPEAAIFSCWRTGRPASVSSAIGEQILQWEGVDLVRKKRRKD